jgi:hypothetical protein
MDPGAGGAAHFTEVCTMDASRFDDLLRSLSAMPSRRGIARAIAASALATPFVSLLALSDAAAKKKKRKKKNKKKRKATCSDGRKNGSESDVDCGGSCPPCANGKSCTGRDDCEGGFCANGACAACATSEQCGIDDNGPCFCEPTVGGPKACNQGGIPVEAESCEACPDGMRCIAENGTAMCVKPCGAPVG